MAEGDTRRIFERLDQMAQEITRLVVLGEAKIDNVISKKKQLPITRSV